jgi:hypothetical protein
VQKRKKLKGILFNFKKILLLQTKNDRNYFHKISNLCSSLILLRDLLEIANEKEEKIEDLSRNFQVLDRHAKEIAFENDSKFYNHGIIILALKDLISELRNKIDVLIIEKENMGEENKNNVTIQDKLKSLNDEAQTTLEQVKAEFLAKEKHMKKKVTIFQNSIQPFRSKE